MPSPTVALEIPNGIRQDHYKLRSSKRTLLSLPAEIRARIYKEIFRDATNTYRRCGSYFAAGHGILLSCKTIYREGIDLYYKRLRLIITCTPGMLVGLDPAGFRHLRRLPQNKSRIENIHLRLFQSVPDMSAFDGLRQLLIEDLRINDVSVGTETTTEIDLQDMIASIWPPLLENVRKRVETLNLSAAKVLWLLVFKIDHCHGEIIKCICDSNGKLVGAVDRIQDGWVDKGVWDAETAYPECGICSTKAVIWFLARLRWVTMQRKKPRYRLRGRLNTTQAHEQL